MRRPALGVACLLVAGLLLAPGPAVAQVPGGDAASGTGSDGFFTFDFDVRSGPSGEVPSGEVLVGCCGGPSIISAEGPVTCLAVSGNRAIIGMRNVSGNGTPDFPYLTIVAVDGGPGGVG